MNFLHADGTISGTPPAKLKEINAVQRFWARIVCQFTDHDVTDFSAWSCQCNRCRKGWHPTTYLGGGVFTIRSTVITAFRYFFRP